MTLDNGTDGQTDRRTDRVRRNMRPPPREEGRIIILFVGAALDSAWEKRCEDLARACDRLRLIGAQDALILLRSSFSAPKVLHLLRCSPSADHQALSNFDAILRRAIRTSVDPG